MSGTYNDRTRPPTSRAAIKGSARKRAPDACANGPTDPSTSVRLSLYARQNPAKRIERARITAKIAQEFPKQRDYLSADAFASIFGAAPDDLRVISAWVERKGFKVLDSDAASRRVSVEAPASIINQVFGTMLTEYEHPTLGRFRGREGPLYVDADVYGLIEGVFGLDTRHVGRSRRRRLDVAPVNWCSINRSNTNSPSPNSALPATPWPGTFYPPQVASLYDFPSSTGKGQNIAVIAFNGDKNGDPHGGYSISALNTYFTQVLGGSLPTISDVVVQGAGNFPGLDTSASENLGDATGELMLDLCVVGSAAPSANIFVYFTEVTSQGWTDALHRAITDANNISVISINYGNPEEDSHGAWTTMGIKVVDQALQAALAKGITICVSSGDDGSSDRDAVGGAQVDFPASSPWVLGVGGTKLVADGRAIQRESVWNEIRSSGGATGGGVSAIFSKPDYQAGANVPSSVNPPHQIGRGIPDVAAVADPLTSMVIMHIDGEHLEVVGGTSVSTLLWASLIARINEAIGVRCGFLNTILYTKLSKNILRDITQGDNGSYSAGVGWDPCTGFGSPGGNALLKALDWH